MMSPRKGEQLPLIPSESGGNFDGVEGVDYSVVYEGGFKAHSEAETADDAFSVVDLTRLSQRAQNPESDYYRFADLPKVEMLQDRLVPYAGNWVRMRVYGKQVDPETGESSDFVIETTGAGYEPFFLGSTDDFANAYLSLIRGYLEAQKAAGQEYGRTTLVTEIWVTYAKKGRKLPNDSQYMSEENPSEE